MRLKNNTELEITKATEADAEALIVYLNQVGGESDNLLFGENEFPTDVELEREVIRTLNTSRCSALFVAKLDGKIVGASSIKSPVRKRIAHQAEIGLSVKKEYWNLGIGTALLETMIEFAKQTAQIEIIHLGVRAGNEKAIRLYQKMGFEMIGRYRNFFKINNVYSDEILMNLYLKS